MKRGAHPLASFVGGSLGNCRHWLDSAVKGAGLRALLAPWVLHTGRGPDSALSAMMSTVIAFSPEAVGIPFVRGGNARSVEAFARLIEAGKGSLHTGADVVRVLCQGPRHGCGAVRWSRNQRQGGGVQRHANTAVRPAASYRYGKGNRQIQLARDAPPQWAAEALREMGHIHLSSGPEAVSKAKAVNRASMFCSGWAPRDRRLKPASSLQDLGTKCLTYKTVSP